MLVTLLVGANVTVANPLHPSKAASPMLVTLLGIVTDGMELQSAKASLPMVSKPSGRVRLLMSWQL